MISKFLVIKFVKNYKNTDNKQVRDSYGYLASVVGILANIFLFIVKISVGLISNSIAVTADAFNNLSDAASSIITFLGFKLASKPADKKHPFGHGRIEYISGLVVSFMVLLVGFEFIKSSFNKIINPSAVNFQWIPFLLILFSIIVKLWLSGFNKYIGNTINSGALKASSLDALSDVITSSSVALSLLLAKWISFPIDGYFGILVSLFILYSGISLIKETLDPLLGEAPDEKLVSEIIEKVMSYDLIMGVHDLIVHNYGPGRCIASIHAEVPSNESIVKIHEVIDKAESEISKELDILLVIHMDPINLDNKEIAYTRNEVAKILDEFPIIKSMHDFRIVGENDYKNLIFDIVIDHSFNLTPKLEDKLKKDIDNSIKKLHPKYNTIITIDRDFY
ncbi:cation diffusion facilitator family transporter [Clostridium tepidum]|jgi:cation diffusion facilitator family transporter|uniref:Cation-efflux pump n=1 Tax=Clostridium tepidum TaxID=1962263 RepID=A0A1S9I670_9CLOT|nr:cation diffusion facilitator family transporter [Clostridium tepidum]MCR1934326.1 cation diffusion facilitator family transporter [Clostridium tepidum]MDU6877992.1 cation diffusion facilitator family transporter [Clostridium botulinum]OOO62305.1 cation-efflux pump [Clostridium tepidum]OOO65755.1 cation-efflux pump [Clostridium tepidum]